MYDETKWLGGPVDTVASGFVNCEGDHDMLTGNLKMLCLSLIGTLMLAAGSTISAQDHFGGYHGGALGGFHGGSHGQSSNSWVGGGFRGVHNHGGRHIGGFGGTSPSHFNPAPFYPSGSCIQPPVWHNTSHLDYHPGSFVPHGNHLHYRPGHYDLHQTGHWHN